MVEIYGASYDFDQSSIFDFGNRAGKQFVWVLTAIGLGELFSCSIHGFTITLLTSLWLYYTFAYSYHFLATDVKGSRSWLVFGPVSFQPAELA